MNTSFKNFTLTTTYNTSNNLYATVASNGCITHKAIYARTSERSITLAKEWVDRQLDPEDYSEED